MHIACAHALAHPTPYALRPRTPYALRPRTPYALRPRTPYALHPTQESSITWHYREADEDFGEIQASDLQMHLERVLSNQPVEISLDAKQARAAARR